MRSWAPRLAVLLLAVLSTSLLPAADVQDMFSQANSAYREGKFAEAIRIYRQILDQGWESGELYYNLGNACFRQNQLGPAILNFERARRFLAGDADLERNLEIANLRTVDKIEPLTEFLPVRFAKSFLRTLSARSWLWIALPCYWATILLLACWRLASQETPRRWLMRSALLLALFGVLAGAFLVGRLRLDRSEVPAVILAPEVAARSAPAGGAAEIFRIHEGTKVRTGTRSEEWTEIILADGKVGWVPSESLELI